MAIKKTNQVSNTISNVKVGEKSAVTAGGALLELVAALTHVLDRFRQCQ